MVSLKLIVLLFCSIVIKFSLCSLDSSSVGTLTTIQNKLGKTQWGTLTTINACSASPSEIICDQSSSYINELNLDNTGVISEIALPPFSCFTQMTSLTLANNILVDDIFWNTTISACSNLNTITFNSLSNPPSTMSLPSSLRVISLVMNSTLTNSIFSFVNLISLSILGSNGFGFDQSLMTSQSSLQILGISGYTSFINPSNAKFFNQLYNLAFNFQSQFPNFDNFDQLSALTILSIYSSGDLTLVDFPTSIFSSKKLSSLTIGNAFNCPTGDHLDFTQTNLQQLDMLSPCLVNLKFPGIRFNKMPSFTLTIHDLGGVYTNISNLDLTNATTIYFNVGALSSPLPDVLSYYKNKDFEVYSNKLTGVVPNSMCTADTFQLQNNLFTDIPSCMKCSITSKSLAIYPNPNLPIYNSTSCTTLQVTGTSLAPTLGGLLQVTGVDMGWNSYYLYGGSFYPSSYSTANTNMTVQVPMGTGINKQIQIQFYPNETYPILKNVTYSYAPPLISAIYQNQNLNLVVNGSNFGMSIPVVSLVVQNITVSQIVALGNNQIITGYSTSLVNTFVRVFLTVDGQSTEFYYNTFPGPPQIDQPSDKFQLAGGQFTITGINLPGDQSIASLTIDSVPCSITNLTTTSIAFGYPSFTTSGYKLLTLNVSGTQYVSQVQIYFSEPLPQCTSVLHGRCVSNQLVCDDGWTGNDCSGQIITTIPNIGNNQPDTSSNTSTTLPNGESIQYTTLVGIQEIREYDGITNNKIHTSPLSTWIVTKISDHLYQYQSNFTSLNSINSTINVTVRYFSESEIVQFAGQNITMNPSSIKYQISLSSYSFSKSYNRLMILMNTELQRDLSDSCSSVQFGQDSTNADTDYLKLSINQVSLYAKFIKYAVIDNRTSYLSNTFISDDTNNSPTKTSSLVGINIPYYSESAELDPDFSVLIDSNSVSSSQESSVCSVASSKSLSKTQLAGIIIGSVCGFLIIVILVGYIALKGKYRTLWLVMKEKMHRFDQSIEMKRKRSTTPMYTGGKVENIDKH